MTFPRRIYTQEFRINAAKLVVDEHRPTSSVAQELSINSKTLHTWVKQYREGTLDKTDSITPEQAENARLRAELQMEFHTKWDGASYNVGHALSHQVGQLFTASALFTIN